jgi:hypothetical protein
MWRVFWNPVVIAAAIACVFLYVCYLWVDPLPPRQFNADDQGENDRSLIASDSKNLTAQPGISCQSSG